MLFSSPVSISILPFSSARRPRALFRLTSFSLLHTLSPPRSSPQPLFSLLDRCATLDQLKQVQAQLVLCGLISHPTAASRLIESCTATSQSTSLDYAGAILARVPSTTATCWNLAIRGHASRSSPKGAVFLYKSMLWAGARPDHYTYPILFKACSKMSDVRAGNGVFGQALKLGFEYDVYVVNTLMHLFAANGRLEDAHKVFDQSCVRDLVSWNTLINAYVQSGLPKEALGVLRGMAEAGIRPDEVTMIGAVACCTELQDLELGRSFHRYIEEKGIELTVRLTNALMDMYVKCESLEPALALFSSMNKRTVVSWTIMIMGYAKFGFLDTARKLFYEMPEKDAIPWNALMSGYIQCKRFKEAIDLFHEMQFADVKPDEVTMVNLLSACSQLGALELGMWIHRFIEKHGICLNVALGTALVDMYAKCGNIEKSLNVFREIPERNALTWTAIICGLASHGHAIEAIDHFLMMSKIGLQPDDVTFVGVLSACCHGGLVDEGRKYFSEMKSKFNILPRIKHYSCMVDLLGRAGHLYEAEELIKTMPMEPDAAVWGTLFFSCRNHGNVAMGEKAACRLLELDPDDAGIYVLLANMYVESNMREKADKVRALMRDAGIEKIPGCSSIEVNGIVHEFLVKDRSHKEQEQIYCCLVQLARQIEEASDFLDLSEIDQSGTVLLLSR